jgi:hypothetical protein
MQKGFFASLFDISFSSLITTRIIKILYVIILVVIGLFSLFAIIAGLSQGGGNAVATIIFVPIAALLYTIFARVYLEIIIVLFKIGENTGEMVRLAGGTPSGVHSLAGAPATASVGAGGGAAAPAAGGGAAAAQASPPSGGQAPGWYSDPQGQKRLRYWDGSSWTEHTSD